MVCNLRFLLSNPLRKAELQLHARKAVRIPKEVEIEKISAAMNDGVLTITIPKKEQVVKTPATRQIEIQ